MFGTGACRASAGKVLGWKLISNCARLQKNGKAGEAKESKESEVETGGSIAGSRDTSIDEEATRFAVAILTSTLMAYALPLRQLLRSLVALLPSLRPVPFNALTSALHLDSIRESVRHRDISLR